MLTYATKTLTLFFKCQPSQFVYGVAMVAVAVVCVLCGMSICLVLSILLARLVLNNYCIFLIVCRAGLVNNLE